MDNAQRYFGKAELCRSLAASEQNPKAYLDYIQAAEGFDKAAGMAKRGNSFLADIMAEHTLSSLVFNLWWHREAVPKLRRVA
ncbi:hypothetical protein FJZ19_00485 [Candidatus Pacearchaeota archaeon]|nr:hypothetical protein [Candidatus Pacearchaeota archaeon]